MVFPTVQQLGKKLAPNKAYAVPTEKNQSDEPTPVWGIWSSGLALAVIGGFIFPFLGVPAVVVAIFAYVDFKTDDWNGFKRKRTITKRLGIAALVVGLILLGLMAACHITRAVHKWHDEHEDFDNYDWSNDDYDDYDRGNNRVNYCRRRDSDCFGHDIKHIVGVSLRNCKDACDNNPECRSIQFFGSKCWLKNYVCQSSELRESKGLGNDWVKREWVQDAGFKLPNCREMTKELRRWRKTNYCEREGVLCEMLMSGRYCHRPDSDCWGHDIKLIEGISMKECLDACDADQDCKSVQHDANNLCWLKNYACKKYDLRTNIPEKEDYVKANTCDGL